MIIPFEWIFCHLNPTVVRKILFILVAILTVDVTLSVKNALDFREMVERLSNSQSVLSSLAKRLDLLLERYDSDNHYRRRLSVGKIEDWFVLPRMLRNVRERMDLMYELMRERRRSQEDRDEFTEQDEFELQSIRDSYMQEEQVQKSYGKRFAGHLKHLMFTSPRAKIIKLGKTLRGISLSEILKISDWKKKE